MKTLEDLDRWISSAVKRWSSKLAGPPQPKDLLEIRREILEDVKSHIQPKGEGRYVFPFTEVYIRMAAADESRAALYESASIDDDIRALLKEAQASIPTVRIEVAIDPAPGPPFQIEYLRRKSAPSAAPAAKLTVNRGSAEPAELAITATRVNIGRLKEVATEREGVRRRNDVAFAETETTVSREHASIRWDPASSRYRIYDTGSQRGTSIFREGRRIEVPRASPVGVPLQSGDEIHLGDARLTFNT